jgi:hypothetical protein
MVLILAFYNATYGGNSPYFAKKEKELQEQKEVVSEEDNKSLITNALLVANSQ